MALVLLEQMIIFGLSMKRLVIIVLMLCVTLLGLATFRHLPAPKNSSVSQHHSSADKAGNFSAHRFSTPSHDNGSKNHFSAIPDQENEDDLRKQTLLVKFVAAFITTFLPEYSANAEAKAFASSQYRPDASSPRYIRLRVLRI